jgi:ligand-binding sensor domain-containing protein
VAYADQSDWFVLGTWRAVANGDDVRAMFADGDGLWTATENGGVVRWNADGSWQQYLAPQDGLPCSSVRDIVKWRGEWWFATCDGLAVYDAGTDRMEAVSANLPSPSVTALAVDTDDRLWVATRQQFDSNLTFPGQDGTGGWVGGGVAYSADGLTFTTAGGSGGLPSLNVTDLTVWRGSVWAATEPYLNWSPPENDGDTERPGRWEHVGGGIARFDGLSWQAYGSGNVEKMSDNVRAIAGDARALWIGTGGRGLVAYDGASWHAHMDCGDAARCIQDNYVTALSVSADGAVWVGTSRFNGRGTGLGVLDPGLTPVDDSDDAWHVIDSSDGLPGELVHAVLPARDGTFWIGTATLDDDAAPHGRGLARLLADRATLEVHSTAASNGGAPADNDVSVVVRHPLSRELWVGTAGAGVSVMDELGRWRHYTKASTGGGLASNNIAAIEIEPNGVVWIATRQATFSPSSGTWTDGGLSRFDGIQWSKIAGPESGLPSDHLSSLELDGTGRLWIGTGATDRGAKEHAFRGWGLAVIDTATQQWQRTYAFPTLTSNNITDIYATDSEVWVATSYFFYVDTRPGGAQVSTGGGVSVFDLTSGTWRKFGDQQGLTVSARSGAGTSLLDYRAVRVDADGKAWVGGLVHPDSRFDPDADPHGIVEVIEGGAVEHHWFTTSGGVSGLEFDPQLHLWATTVNGGARVRVNGDWLDVSSRSRGLPSNRLTDLSFGGSEFWLGTAGSGVLQLVPPATAGGEPADPVIVRRLPHKIFVPSVKRTARGRPVLE